MSRFVTSIARDTLGDYGPNVTLLQDRSGILTDIERLKQGGEGFTKRYRITPNEAQTILDGCKFKNRKPLSGNIHSIVKQIQSGTFVYNKENIKIAREYDSFQPLLLDGQHRLNACIKANIPIDTDVMFYSPMPILNIESIMDSLDSGKSRTIKDVFNRNGISNAVNKLGVVRCLLYFYNQNYPYVGYNKANHKTKTLTSSECLDFYYENKTAIDSSVGVVGAFHKQGVRSGAETGAIHCHFRFKLNNPNIDDFTNSLITGENLTRDSLGYKTRKFIIQYGGSTGVNRISLKDRNIALNMAYEAFVNKKKVSFTPIQMDNFLEQKGLPRIYMTESKIGG